MRATLAYIAIPLLVLLGATPAYPDIFRYVDDQGVVHFSNVPCEPDAQSVIRERPASTAKAGGPVLIPSGSAKAELASYTPGACEPVGDDVPYARIINERCGRYGVDPTLVKAIIKAESNFNPRAVSSKGAKGLMQLMPATASMLEVTDVFDPADNIDGGVRYVRYLLDNFGGDVELTVAAYNCGEGRVARSGNVVPDISETKNYVKKVMKLSNNPITGKSYTKPIYKMELTDGSVLFTDNPVGAGDVSLVD